ncbi:MAG: AraC family transcriptional regulator [Rhodothermia bacterium]|nr:AraC family transcriptional regulator [Rhodothermia bacterium]
MRIKEGLSNSKLSIIEEEEILQTAIEDYLSLLEERLLPIDTPIEVIEFYFLVLKNLFKGQRINQLKDEYGYTGQNFSRLFAKWVGMKPKEFCIEHAITIGVFLLRETSCSIGGIALALGFQTQDAFGKAIKRRLGVGPLRLRRESPKN